MAKTIDVSKATKVGKFNLLLNDGQILVYDGRELIKAITVKNIHEDKDEFNTFVTNFTVAHDKRYNITQ